MSRTILSVFVALTFFAPAAFAEPSAVTTAADASAPAVAATAAVVAPAPVDPLLAPVETPAFKSLFSPGIDAQSTAYEVKSGDNLTGIAKKHQATTGAIKLANDLKTDRLRPGQKLKIPSSKFSIVVDKSQNTLLLKGDETILKTYRVSTGENNATPVGVFKITDKLKDPVWYKEEKDGSSHKIPAGSPKNQLGSRWIGIDKPGYGIHGTLEPEKLGTQCTQGCVRMRNEEVEELFEIVPPGTEVTIVD